MMIILVMIFLMIINAKRCIVQDIYCVSWLGPCWHKVFGGRSADPIKIVSVIIKKHAQNIIKRKKKFTNKKMFDSWSEVIRVYFLPFVEGQSLLNRGNFLIELQELEDFPFCKDQTPFKYTNSSYHIGTLVPITILIARISALLKYLNYFYKCWSW